MIDCSWAWALRHRPALYVVLNFSPFKIRPKPLYTLPLPLKLRLPKSTSSSAMLTLTTTTPFLLPTKRTPTHSPTSLITCGPRDNRGPLVRGRTLSTEAILAVQSLKRSRQNPTKLSHLLSSSLPRLLTPDLTAAMAELLRQDLPLLALLLLPLLPSPTLSLYADILNSLSRTNSNGDLDDEIDKFLMRVLGELGREGGVKGGDLRGPARLMKAMVGAGRGREVKEVYGLMKRGGCVPNEYLFGFLVRGLRRLGNEEGAKMVERDYEEWDVNGKWGEVEDEEEEMGLVGV